eukprot:5074280-Amphidinium_carterae.1
MDREKESRIGTGPKNNADATAVHLPQGQALQAILLYKRAARHERARPAKTVTKTFSNPRGISSRDEKKSNLQQLQNTNKHSSEARHRK